MPTTRKQQRRLEARAKVLKAMAHPSRLLIIEELEKGERCVCELTDLIGADMSTVSRHLSLLRNAGLIADRREGVKIFYTLRTPCLKGFFSCVESVLKQQVKERRQALS